MSIALGYFDRLATGYSGYLSLLGQKLPASLQQNAARIKSTQPDFRLLLVSGAELGAGWIKRAKGSGRTYLSLTLQHPQIAPRPIYANLVPVKGQPHRFVLLWCAPP